MHTTGSCSYTASLFLFFGVPRASSLVLFLGKAGNAATVASIGAMPESGGRDRAVGQVLIYFQGAFPQFLVTVDHVIRERIAFLDLIK